ncbi:Ribose import binding protein RbsB [Austwickia sp. TVS 96-490-7B]|uniref:substrate-binding domain-containing protein n=1 Tax=Austwickia sp. TVS 96-490-7B TaxID=2830843 RepID=UPI001C56AFE2|nr:substrate-binding domain-containing protein [Austwickia sp. TVS 96-490-7B]MBW3085022.1 Ribose import binding protein RbsB [Austwickia sp. TVS 96-490-7B]
MSSTTRRTLAVALLAGTLAVSTTACNRESSSSGGKGSSGGTSITLALSTLNNPFFVDLRDGAQDAAKAAGSTINVVDAQNDAATQANQLADAATKKPSAVIINPVDSDAAGAAVKPVSNAKIPVIGVDRGVNGVDIATLVSSDNVAGGKQAAEALAKAIGEKGEILILQGVAGTSASRDRGQGFEEGLKAFPQIKVAAKQPANFERAQGLNVTTNLLQSHPNVTAVFAENDEMALGAVQALGAKAGKEVKVFGFDGTADGLKAVKAGTMVGTIAQQPKVLGQKAVELALQIADGKQVDKKIPVEVKTVEVGNVGEYLK